ncbi:MAG: AAA family ATPase [Sandaracinaceae bacterium]
MSDRTKSLRVHLVELDDGRVLATLIRTRESFFDAFPPSAYGETTEDVLGQLDVALRGLLATREDELARYLWKESFHVRAVPLSIHPATVIEKQPVVGKREVPLRLSYVWCEMKSGAFRVMLPRFRWWMMLEDLESARKVLEQAVSGALLGEDPAWLFEFRRQGDERVIEWTPDWLKKQASRPESPLLSFARPKVPTMEAVADDWVARAAKKKLAPVIGDDPGFESEARVLAQPLRPSLLLVGERGVGKTTFVRRLARWLLRQQRAGRDVPRRLWATSADRVLAGMIYLGMWQERVLEMVRELEGEDELLYLGALPPILRPQGDGSAIADLLAPAVLNGGLPVIAECTEAELVQARRRAGRFVDAFRVVRLAEPPRGQVVSLMRTWSARRELDVHPAALDRLVRHLDAFSRHQRFPGKGFAMLDWLAQQRPGRIDPSDASRWFAKQAGLPFELIADEASATVDEMAARLREGVIGQDAACQSAGRVLARFKAGLSDPERPLGNLLFVGPTGVGKTELAKQLARVLFGDARRMVRVDLSEYMVPGAVERLRQVGHGVTSLAEQVHRQPLSLVLFDELEKAHPEVFDLLLGVLGEGRLTDAMGRLVDFRMTVIVLTSNVGAAERPPVGFDAKPSDDFARAIRDRFRPELVNRLDHVVSFRHLDLADVRRICDLELSKALRRAGLHRRNLQLLVHPEARDRLAELGFHPRYGARPLRRVIEERVFTPLAARIASDPGFRDRRVEVVAGLSSADHIGV